MLASTNKKYKSIGDIGQNTTKSDRPIPIPEKKADTTDTDTIGASLLLTPRVTARAVRTTPVAYLKGCLESSPSSQGHL